MPSFRRAFRLFRVFGVSVYLDYSWFLFFFLVVWTFGRFYFPQQYPALDATAAWLYAVIAAILLFAAVTFHEMSHAVTSNRLGFPIQRITLFIFGGVAHLKSEPDNPKTEFLVAAAGPISSLVLWIAFTIAAMVAQTFGAGAPVGLFILIAQLNLALAVFNLVPGFPLDGGRLLRAVVWWKSGSLKKATNIAAKCGEAFAYILMFFGVATFFLDPRSGWISGIWYILIGVFLKNAAEQSYQHVLLEEFLEGVPVSEIMGSAVMAVSSRESLEELIEEKFLHHKFPAYPVIDGEGRVVGLVDVESVKAVPREERERRSVGDVMTALPQTQLPRPTTRALDALREMLSLGLVRLPVVDETGHLAGLVTRGDIMSMFQIRSDLVV